MPNDKPAVMLSHEQLQELLAGVLAKANQMNPLEAEKYHEELEKRRRTEIFKNTVRSEVAAQQARLQSCSHCRWPATAGKLGGHAAPRGQGEWVTGGQIHGRGIIGLTCLRCGNRWLWQGTQDELEYAESAGLLNFPPPAEERCLTACRHCSEFFTNKQLTQHEGTCPKKLMMEANVAEAALLARSEHA